jgi:hypothetical protein
MSMARSNSRANIGKRKLNPGQYQHIPQARFLIIYLISKDFTTYWVNKKNYKLSFPVMVEKKSVLFLIYVVDMLIFILIICRFVLGEK